MPAKLIQHLGTGRRKTATARVILRPGKGQITVNKRPFEDYFVSESARRLGVARALIEFNPELRPKLKQLGFLTRDPRAHERKKYGQKGARKRFQFSKR